MSDSYMKEQRTYELELYNSVKSELNFRRPNFFKIVFAVLHFKMLCVYIDV